MLGNYKEILNMSLKVTINLPVSHSGHTLVLVCGFFFIFHA